MEKRIAAKGECARSMSEEKGMESFEYHNIATYREKYKVLAKFYINNVGQGARLFADVVDRKYLDAPIDAYLVMINPGSCRKKDAPVLASEYYKALDVVEAVSDPAQKCVMAFMDLCGLKKVRILNLMDYRSGNYGKAMKVAADQSIAESLFSPERKGERRQVMAEKAPIIAAWGTDSRLADLKKQAVGCLGENIIGVHKDGKEAYDFEYIKPPTINAQMERILELAKCFKEKTA